MSDKDVKFCLALHTALSQYEEQLINKSKNKRKSR